MTNRSSVYPSCTQVVRRGLSLYCIGPHWDRFVPHGNHNVFLLHHTASYQCGVMWARTRHPSTVTLSIITLIVTQSVHILNPNLHDMQQMSMGLSSPETKVYTVEHKMEYMKITKGSGFIYVSDSCLYSQ
jgi:hypothetical protein